MIKILVAGVIAALLAMTFMEKQVTVKGKLKNLPADTQQQLNAIIKENEQVRDDKLKEMGL
mgnify:CR=1 FL=1